MAKNTKLMFRRWMSYRAAQMTLKDYGIKSRSHYWKWWDNERTRPPALPKYPNRVYVDEWTCWSDFLNIPRRTFDQWVGISNKRRGKTYRNYHEAIRWVHAQKFPTVRDYTKAHTAGKVPKDLPYSPQKYYKEWISWDHWLGRGVKARIESAKVNLGILAVCIPTDMQAGFLQTVIVKDGWQQLKDVIISRGNLRALKLYQWLPGNEAKLTNVLSYYGRKKADDLWIVGNIHEVLYALDQEFDWFRPPA